MGQRCRWGRDADGAEMQMGQRCRWGRDADEAEMQMGQSCRWGRDAERYIGRKRQRDMGRDRWGDRETIAAICTDSYRGKDTIIATDQRQIH